MVRMRQAAKVMNFPLSCRTPRRVPLEFSDIAGNSLILGRERAFHTGGFPVPIRHQADMTAAQPQPRRDAALDVTRKFGPKSVGVHLSCEANVVSLEYSSENIPERVFRQEENCVAVKKEELPLWARKLYALQKRLGFSRQGDFAAALGTRQGTLSKWLNGSARPLPGVFTRIASLAEGEERAFFLKEAGVIDSDLAHWPIPHNKTTAVGLTPDEIVSLDSDILFSIIEAASHELARRNRAISAGRERPRRRA